jgi:phospholipase/carboxylesterase
MEARMDSSQLGLHHIARPPRVQGAEPYPTLLLLHGRGADEGDLLPVADELDPRLFVVSARAPLPLWQGFEWYRLANIGNPEPNSFAASLDALQQFVAMLPRSYPIDPSRLFTLGFSQGAVMAGSLLLTRPDAVAGTIMLSGYLPLDQKLPIDEAKLVDCPVFVAHGTADPLIPIAWGRAVRDYFARVGANLTYREYPIAHFIGPEELTDVSEWLTGALGTGG